MWRNVVALGLVVILAGCDNEPDPARPPSPSREGETWGHADLIAFLRKKGVHVVVLRHPSGSGNFATTSTLEVATRYQVDVNLEATTRQAREYADDRGQRGYSWGKFCFIGDKSAIRIIRQALEG